MFGCMSLQCQGNGSDFCDLRPIISPFEVVHHNTTDPTKLPFAQIRILNKLFQCLVPASDGFHLRGAIHLVSLQIPIIIVF